MVKQCSAFKWSQIFEIIYQYFVPYACSCFRFPPPRLQTTRMTFATPEDVHRSLIDAVKAKDNKELLAILGPSLKEWIEFWRSCR